ncbi:MAG: hypothetical protein ACTHOF_10250 [Flavisolibacter sp.]
MELLDFKIGFVRNSRADINFIFSEAKHLNFSTSYITQSFSDLTTALIENRHGKDVQKVLFDMESYRIDLLLINCPGDILLVQFYEDVFWNSALDDLPKQPKPPEISFFTDWHTFSFRIVEELRKHTEDEFKAAGFIYPKEQIKILNKKMTGIA